MPAPYSDNLYSAGYDDVSGDDQDALSPTNGYFHASSPEDGLVQYGQQYDGQQYDQAATPHQHRRTSSQIPHVPNVMVEDPTLREQHGADKAREAEEERLLNETARSASESHHYQPSAPRHSHSHSQSPSHSHSYPHPINTATSSTTSTAPYTTSSPYQYSRPGPTSPTHHHRRSVDEDSPIISSSHIASVPSPYSHAPPAYSPSASSPPSGPSQGYQTFAPAPLATHPVMGAPEEQQSLLPREPQSMGGPPEGPKPSLWQRVKDAWSAPILRKKIKTLLGVLVVISIVLALFGSVSLRSDHSNNEIIHDEPVRAPESPSQSHRDMEWNNRGNCRDTPRRVAKVVETVSFGSHQSLSVIQTLEKQDNFPGRSPRVSGEVIVRPSTDSSQGSIEVEVISNYDDLSVQINFDERRQALKITTPRSYQQSENVDESPCIQIRATVLIPQRSYLRDFTVDTVHLDVDIRDGLVLGVSNNFSIKTVAGGVSTPSPDHDGSVVPYTIESRTIIIRTVSGSIKGWYPLYDLLKLATVSGDVSLDISPKPAASSKSSEPAVLEMETASGKLKVSEPLDRALGSSDPFEKLPARDYVVKAATVSGDISADVAMSSLARFESQSGKIVLRLLPILGSKQDPNIETSTTSGDVGVTVLEPLLIEKASIGGSMPAEPAVPADDDPFVIIHPDDARTPAVPELNLSEDTLKRRDASESSTGGGSALSNLRSQHATISGHTVARYPSSWEGQLKAVTISGNQKVRGKGLEVTTNKGWVEKVTKGHKGSGKSSMKLESMSGDQDILIGK